MIPHAASSPDAPGREARNSISVDHDAADRFTAVHEIETFVDVLEPQRMRDHRVDGNPPVPIPVDDLGNIGPSLAPPNAVPRHTRPVTSWNGRVAISCPPPATL